MRLASYLLGAACVCGIAACAADEDPDRISRILQLESELSQHKCRCDSVECFSEDSDDNDERQLCVDAIIRRHEREFSVSSLECAIDALERQLECFDRAGCDLDQLDRCGDRGISQTCGRLPEALENQIVAETERECPDWIDCADGSSVVGNDCNDVAECADGSDEFFCEDSFLVRCSDGAQIQRNQVCDGAENCSDGGDERRCSDRGIDLRPPPDPGRPAGDN
jgi:hypothetical protein